MAGTHQTRWTAVLFDFDGTLGDSIDLIISSVRATAAELPDYAFDESTHLERLHDFTQGPMTQSKGQCCSSHCASLPGLVIASRHELVHGLVAGWRGEP